MPHLGMLSYTNCPHTIYAFSVKCDGTYHNRTDCIGTLHVILVNYNLLIHAYHVIVANSGNAPYNSFSVNRCVVVLN